MVLTSQFRTRRPLPSGSSDVAPMEEPKTEHWALAVRDDPTATKGATHRCSICNRMFRQSEILIAQTDPNHDVDGQLYKLCYECCQCRGPAYEENPTVRGEVETLADTPEAQSLGKISLD